MYEIQKLYIDYEKALITFDCIDLERKEEQIARNPFLTQEFGGQRFLDRYEPKHDYIEYDCLKGEEVHLLMLTLKKFAPEAKTLIEGAEELERLALIEGKTFKVFYASNLKKKFFCY